MNKKVRYSTKPLSNQCGLILYSLRLKHQYKNKKNQSKVLRTLINAPHYVPNNVIINDLGIDTICETVYKILINAHLDKLAKQLFDKDDNHNGFESGTSTYIIVIFYNIILGKML